jgi:putative ABC transport system permease protein
MKAVRTKMWADLRRRKLQTIIITIVILLSSGAATLALSLLIESDAPYDRAFAQANGAHLTVTFAADTVTPAQLRRTATLPGVTQSAGPWPEVTTGLNVSGIVSKGPGPQGSIKTGITIVGRDNPYTSVDHLTIESGRWARASGEIVLSQRIADRTQSAVGGKVTIGDKGGGLSLTVVGIAASVSPSAQAWVLPSQIAALAAPGEPLSEQMLYRVSPAATAGDLRRATQTIAGALPRGAVENSENYLDVKKNADLTSAVMVPFLIAFSVFALAAALLIIGNVVSGVVISSYREIGIMKSVGFSPGQVIAVLLAQIITPALLGCLVGIPLGTVVSQPFLQQTAHALGLPAPFTAVIPVDVLILCGIVAASMLAAIVPAWRAGHLSAVTAITIGSAPAAGRASGAGRQIARLPLPRSITLGVADALARPLRSAMTLGAITIGVAIVIFSLSLHLSLTQVAAHLIRDNYVQVTVDAPPTASYQQVAALLRAQPDTAKFTAIAEIPIRVPGIAEPISFFAYRGASSWTGFAMIEGRWFNGPGEVVAPTLLLDQAHLAVGQSITARLGSHIVRLKVVGEILDQTNGDLLLRGDWSTLAATGAQMQPDHYEVSLKPGANPNRYVEQIYQSPLGLDPRTAQSSSDDTTFILLNGVIFGLAVILTAIAVAGVFNTVVLNTREKTRDVAILKAVGMAPRQVVTMVVASVAVLGIVAGALGIPVGHELHRQILTFMGQVASGTALPPPFFDLIDHRELALLALTGVLVAALGAWVPAQWAARSGVAEVLQSE